MRIVLMAGGYGKRLYPLSDERRGKQLLKLIYKEDGKFESMLEHMYYQIKRVLPSAKICVSTSIEQSQEINSLLPEVDICVEPISNNTYGSVLLSCLYLNNIKNEKDSEVLFFVPIDQIVEDSFFELFINIEKNLNENQNDIALIGLKRHEISNLYGYILPKYDKVFNEKEEEKIECFVEKPDLESAKQIISRGGVINAGVFAAKLHKFMGIVEKQIGQTSFENLYENYEKVKKQPFDEYIKSNVENAKVFFYDKILMDIGSLKGLFAYYEQIISQYKLELPLVINETQMNVKIFGKNPRTMIVTEHGIIINNEKEGDQLI